MDEFGICAVAWALLDDEERAAVAAYPNRELTATAWALLEPLGLAHRTAGMLKADVPYLDATMLDWVARSTFGTG